MKIKAQCGLVSGSTVRAKNVFLDFGSGLKNTAGGRIKILKSYTTLLSEVRKETAKRMIE